MHSDKKAQCILVEGTMHSGKKAQCILVKSDEFENRTPFYVFFLNLVYVAARSLRSLRSNNNNNNNNEIWFSFFTRDISV